MRCAGVSLPTKQQAFGVELVLNGMGVRSVTIFNTQVWVGGLYLERRTQNPADVLSRKRTKLMVMTFLQDSERTRMIEALRNGMASQPAPIKKMAQHNLTDFERLLPDPHKGGRLLIAYGQGRLELRHNSTVIGSWNDPALAEAIFSAWLGSKPVDSGLKEGLLGGQCD